MALAGAVAGRMPATQGRDGTGGPVGAATDPGRSGSRILASAPALAPPQEDDSDQGARLSRDAMTRRPAAGVMDPGAGNGNGNGIQGLAHKSPTEAGQGEQKPGLQAAVTGNNPPARGDGLLALSQSTVLPHQPGGGIDARAAQITVQLATPFSQPDWGNALSARVAWQAGQGIQQARILVNPPELGPIQISVTVQHDQASIQFVAHHGVVRHAIEQAMPQLRDMLGQSGMTLGDSSVSQHAAGGQQQFGGAMLGDGGGSLTGSGGEGVESGELVLEARQVNAEVLLDAYA